MAKQSERSETRANPVSRDAGSRTDKPADDAMTRLMLRIATGKAENRRAANHRPRPITLAPMPWDTEKRG